MIIYVTTGAWGSGTGVPNSAAQVDGNFYTHAQAIAGLEADLAEGKRIDFVTYTDADMTFHFTDGTTQVIPLPVATIAYAGEWMNSTGYQAGVLVSVRANGMYQVLQTHVTPDAPAAFDPDATDETTDQNPLYSLFFPLRDVNYDAAVFVPGSLQREEGDLLFSGVANRAMELPAGTAGAYAYLDAGIESTAGTDIIISIQKNREEIGFITFEAPGDLDSDGGQAGVFTINVSTDFAAGDIYSLRVTQSENAEPSGLSVTLPFIRMDI